jgi:hypothetical protein
VTTKTKSHALLPARASEPRPLRRAVTRLALPTAAFLQGALAAIGCHGQAHEEQPRAEVPPPEASSSVVVATASASASVPRVPAASASTSTSGVARAPASTTPPAASSGPPIDPLVIPIDAAGGLRPIGPIQPTGVGSAAPCPTPTMSDSAVSARPQVAAVVAKNRWRLRACANQALRADPSIHGTFVIRGTIDVEGKVVSASASGGNAGLAACFAEALRAMRFQEGDSDAVTPITVTVVVTTSA